MKTIPQLYGLCRVKEARRYEGDTCEHTRTHCSLNREFNTTLNIEANCMYYIQYMRQIAGDCGAIIKKDRDRKLSNVK